MTDAAIVTVLNALIASVVDRIYADIADVFECVNLIEYNAMTAANKSLLAEVMKLPQVNVKGPNMRAWITAITVGSPLTRAALIALQKTSDTTSIAINVFGVSVTTQDLVAARAA